MSEPIVIVSTEPEPEAEPASLEREVGRLEAETENLSETVADLGTETETAQETAETAAELAVEAIQETWATKQDLEEVKAQLAALTVLLAEEEEDDHESSEPEIVDLPEATETPDEVAVEPERTGFLATISKALHGK